MLKIRFSLIPKTVFIKKKEYQKFIKEINGVIKINYRT